MLYRETGQFKTSYAADQAIFPILQDRIGTVAILAIAFVGVPLFATEYLYTAILIPFLILALAALGLNLLVGYCGQLSLGTGAFMAIGAYAAYKLATYFPFLNVFVLFALAGGIAALVGVLFGVPSLRIKGFYLAVATLAAQFFVDWLFIRIKWFTNYQVNAVAPEIVILGYPFDNAAKRYLLALFIVVVMALIAKNLVRGRIGRAWMAVRDMDIAAEIIGIPLLRTKLLAFAVSSFYCGVAGAMWGFLHLGAWEPLTFDINRSFQVLFMVIIGGLGSILGCFLGAAFISIIPILLNQVPAALGVPISTALASHLEFMIFGALIIFFLIAEPHGLARLWQVGKEKLRLWPFPH
ncbi:MAG TPA: branched-chain amino acid ABC transporter permease [Alphaproteobacteria bacterium]|nr:branched-chain amino acid ABC transporter permease [Alphaproteobacteria bacterium]